MYSGSCNSPSFRFSSDIIVFTTITSFCCCSFHPFLLLLAFFSFVVVHIFAGVVLFVVVYFLTTPLRFDRGDDPPRVVREISPRVAVSLASASRRSSLSTARRIPFLERRPMILFPTTPMMISHLIISGWLSNVFCVCFVGFVALGTIFYGHKMQEKKNWSMTSTEGKTFRRGTPDREWEFSINDFVYTICLCNEAFHFLFY